MDRDQLRTAMHQSLLMPDKRADLHNTYPARARARDEQRAQAALCPRSDRVQNVVPIRGRDPEPPRSAA